MGEYYLCQSIKEDMQNEGNYTLWNHIQREKKQIEHELSNVET